MPLITLLVCSSSDAELLQLISEDEILKPEESSMLGYPLLSQPIISGLQIALVDLLAAWGIQPDGVAGHSSGEMAAAYAAGMLSMEGAMTVAYHRGIIGTALLENGVKGSMMAVGLSASEARLYVAALRTGRATVACENGPTNVTVSGDTAAIEELETFLQDKGIFTRRLAVEVAYHSHHMRSIADEYLQSIAHINPLASNRPTQFFSSVSGSEVFASDLSPDYWVQNLVDQAKLVDAVHSLCFDTGTSAESAPKQLSKFLMPKKAAIDTLIEIGPHAELAGPIKQILKSDRRLTRAQVNYESVLARGMDATVTALDAAASLVCQGYPVDLGAVNCPDAACEPHILKDFPSSLLK